MGTGNMSRWGGVPLCPGCSKPVYPTEQVFSADRKPFLKNCLNCQAMNCRNLLTERSLYKHEGFNICSNCFMMITCPREYLAEGEETSAEKRARLAREAEDRARKREEREEERMRLEMEEGK